VMVVFSTTSLDRAIEQLKILSEMRGEDRSQQAVSSVDTLLNDLTGTRTNSQLKERLLSTDQMAALSVTFEIIESLGIRGSL
jgi:HJR/Mrr/RecB family endonuclease